MDNRPTAAAPEGEPVSTSSAAADASPSRIDRRTAMKAAVGGAAAVAVWSAPRIEGLSIAPDIASAASCTGGTASYNKASNDCGYYGDTECWGGNCCNTVAYGPVNVPNTGSPLIQLNGNIGGSVNDDNGFINMTLSNIDPPFRSCTINVSGNCNNGGSWRSRNGTSFTFNDNSTLQAQPDCQGGGATDPNGNITLAINCVCL